MLKKIAFLFLYLLLVLLIAPQKVAAQVDKNEFLAAFKQLNVPFTYAITSNCAPEKNAGTEDIITHALAQNAVGFWGCCKELLQYLTNKTNQLSDKEKVHLLLARAEFFTTQQLFDSAYLLASTANMEATKKEWWPEKAKALLLMSTGALKLRNIASAYAWADSVLLLSRKYAVTQLQGQAFLQMGLCARRNFNSATRRAFPYYLQAINIAEKNNDTVTLFTSNMYYALDNFEIEQWAEGLPYFKKAMALAVSNHNVFVAYTAYIGIGFPLQKLRLNKEAFQIYSHALALSKQQNFCYNIQHTYFALAAACQELHQYDNALVYADSSANVPGVDSLWANTSLLKAGIYEDMNNYKMAAAMYVKALDWAHQDFLYRNQKQLSGYEAQLKTSEKELQVVQEKKRSLQLEWIIFAGAVLLLLSIIAYFFLQRSKQKLAEQNSIIQKQQIALEQSLGEKDILLKEIHHRVKNNLSVISSLLELQSSGIDDEKAKAAIAEGQGRVRSIALIHQRLYQHDNLAAIEFAAFVNDMASEVSGIFKKPGQELYTNIQVPETSLDIDTAVPLGLILNELLTNSFKYAFTSNKAARIDINLTCTKQGYYNLIYTDNGPGMPEEFDLKKSKSLGLRLIYRLSTQIGGNASYTSANGCRFIISFKNALTRNMEA